MKIFPYALSLVFAFAVQADVINLTNGQKLNGIVSGYGNMMFDITLDTGGDMRQSAATIKSIEFVARPSKLEVRSRGAIEGTVTTFEGGVFTVEQEGGKTEKFQAMMVSGASFGGSSKKFMIIPGGNPVDLRKLLAPQKVTILFFYTETSGPAKAVASQLEKINKEDPVVALRKVDIVKTGSPVCKQFDIKSVPRTDIYDRSGKLIGSVSGNSLDAFNTYLRVAKEGK